MMRFLIRLILAGALTIGCSDSKPQPKNQSLVVIVESALYDSLEASLDQYAETMRREQFEIYVEPWGPGSIQALRQRLFDYIDLYQIDGALLVGDFPAAWYEQAVFRPYEAFPTDIYLQDRDAEWVDQDGNDIYDFHTDNLHVDIYTARLQGTRTQLQDYFDRVHHYRHVGPLVDESAFIFIDDKWSETNTEDGLGLSELYDDVEVVKDKAESTLDNYLARLTGDGAEFVYQKNHGGEENLSFAHVDEEGNMAGGTLTSSQVAERNLKVSFVNMTNCFAAQFLAEASVAEAYTVGTDYGLAIIGLTKEGVIVKPRVFHLNLARGMSWGQAYRAWFNEAGKNHEESSLGVVIMGDPLLTLAGHPLAPGTAEEGVAPSGDNSEYLAQDDEPDCDLERELGGFEEYRNAHPEFFED